jgi:hypothetical protein
LLPPFFSYISANWLVGGGAVLPRLHPWKIINTSFQELWGPDCPPVFGATMAYNRFAYLLSHIRLDDSTVREEARRHDKFAAARKSEMEKFLSCPFALIYCCLLPLAQQTCFITSFTL